MKKKLNRTYIFSVRHFCLIFLLPLINQMEISAEEALKNISPKIQIEYSENTTPKERNSTERESTQFSRHSISFRAGFYSIFSVNGAGFDISYMYDLWKDRLRLSSTVSYAALSLNKIDIYNHPEPYHYWLVGNAIQLSCFVEIDAIRTKCFSWTFGGGPAGQYFEQTGSDHSGIFANFAGAIGGFTSFRFMLPNNKVAFELRPLECWYILGKNYLASTPTVLKISFGVWLRL